MMKILNRSIPMISEIESFWDTIGQAALVFRAGTRDFFEKKFDRMAVRLEEIDRLEAEADQLRRTIKHDLYARMLIPESRGDVLGVLETSDNAIDRTKKILNSLDIEKPDIPASMVGDFIELSSVSASAVEEMVRAARAFFSDIKIINDFINKAYFYEHEADKLEDRIKRKAFTTGEISELSRRVQLRYFAERLSMLSDDAEAVCERLTIYAIKRSI
jgi:predicted phosphate transport protein (TIGR00153 family)